MVGGSRYTRRALLAAGGTVGLVWIGLIGVIVGLGRNGPRGQFPPDTSFRFGYDAGARELTAIHESGDAVPAAELFLRGDGIETGRWDRLGGTTSDTTDEGQSRVTKGDTLTLSDVPSDYEVRLVWEPVDGDRVVTLAENTGSAISVGSYRGRG